MTIDVYLSRHKIPEPFCRDCKKPYEIRFSNFDDKKPELLLMFGLCEKCHLITVQKIINLKEGSVTDEN